jgi:hypothetical protein
MASRGRGARIKGANFERQLAKLITENTPLIAKRGLGQTRGGGSEISDVDIPLLHIEAKRHKRCNIKAALEQAIADAKNNGKIPVAITKDDRREILVTMRFCDWINMFNCYLESQNVQDTANKQEIPTT